MKSLNMPLAILALSLMATCAAAHDESAHGMSVHMPAANTQQPWGIAGDPKSVTRTVDIVMSDAMRFSPDHLDVRQGETLRLRVRNDGKLPHEMVIGSRKSLADHAAMMEKSPAMQHDDPDAVNVAQGKTGEIVWRFNRAGEFDFACLVAGHLKAGMRGTIKVVAR